MKAILLISAILVSFTTGTAHARKKADPVFTAFPQIHLTHGIYCENGTVIQDLEGQGLNLELPIGSGENSLRLEGLEHRIQDGETLLVKSDSGEFVPVATLEQKITFESLQPDEQARCAEAKFRTYISLRFRVKTNVISEQMLLTNVSPLKKSCRTGAGLVRFRGDLERKYSVSYVSRETGAELARGHFVLKQEKACITAKTLGTGTLEVLALPLFPFVYIYWLIVGMPG